MSIRRTGALFLSTARGIFDLFDLIVQQASTGIASAPSGYPVGTGYRIPALPLRLSIGGKRQRRDHSSHHHHHLPYLPSQQPHFRSYVHILRSYLVYSACSIPPLIDNAPGLLHFFTHSPIPGLKGLTEAIVRRTFFAQFVPGENVGECTPKMEELRERNIGAVLNYSAEAECETKDDARRLQQARLKEVYRALEGAGEFEDRVAAKGGLRGSTAFALKVTGLIDPDILARASTTILRLRPLTHSNAPSSPFSAPLPPVPYPGTPSDVDSRVVAHPKGDDGRVLLALKGTVEGDMEELRRLWGDLRDLGSFAKRKGVKLMIDAEHTWYQPALDAYTLLLSQEFNRPPRKSLGGVSSEWNGPLIFGTYQSYLTRQPQHLLAAIRHAESDGYALGVKLVRGAYF
ncbi:hypothetical protein EHS25_002817, partial [Saitozyma podzolica]